MKPAPVVTEVLTRGESLLEEFDAVGLLRDKIQRKSGQEDAGIRR